KRMFDQLKDKVQPIETLFIFGTNRQALQTVIEDLKQELTKTGEHQLSLFEVNPEVKKENIRLLIPVYKLAEQFLAERKKVAKFEVDPNELEDMRKFVEATDDRVLMMLCDAEPTKLMLLRKSLTKPDEFYIDGKRHGNTLRLLRRVLDWWAIVPEEFDRLKELEDEIRHFR
ncbi:MAG: restriction endonuclease subunit R, partial [Armatimonadetes bacterium]|nr:restriction endonuclease subunit R [Armatimonadota bacterium]